MKKFIISILLSVLLPTIATAQSMTDEQVIKFVMEQQQMGKSQQQIVTQLMQKGVSIDQIRRIRQKYEKQNGQTSLGAVDITGESKVNDRMRTNNGKVKESDNGNASYRVKENEETRKKRFVNRAEGEAEDNYQMRRELSTFLPDSTEIYDQMYMEEMMAKLNNKRKVFGRDIFNNKNLTFEPNMNIATPQNYRLGAGDVVYIDIYGASQKSLQCTITPDGDAVVEGYGPINIAGLTVAQANAKVRSTLGTRYSSSKIKLTVGQTKTIMVNVMGEVMAPGTYTLSAFASVFHALYMAGGTNDIGTMRNIKVYRNNSLVTTVDIYDYILNGKLSGNIRLADNDVIVVGTYDCMVNMTGKVKRPMFYEMKKEESLATAIKYAGGFAGDAYKKTVRVIRKAGSKYSVFNISEFDMASFHLDDEDSISVDSVIPRYSNMAEIKGAVFRPGLYQVGGEITSVRALLEHAEGCTEDAFTDHAVMHRMKEDRTLEVISVDVAGILNGTVPDIALRNEDVLFVPSKKDLQEEQTLTIHGEVMYPGIYRFADNETLEDFVLQAGGLTDAASVMKVDVARRITNTTATTASDTIAHTFTFALKDGFVIDGTPGFVLKPYDEVYVRRSPGYSEQQNVKIEGEVLFAGTYTLNKKSQRLSEMIKQAGGLTNTAYAEGARLVRKYTPEEKMRDEALLKMAKANANGKDSIDIKKLDLGETYDVGINLDKALASPNSDFDIVLREGDRIIVPEYSGTVRISGDVMYPNTVAYKEGKGIGYYVDQAGGWGSTAKKSQTYIIYMNGTIAKAGYHTKPMPGCQIVVPSKEQGKKMTTAEIVAIGSGTASIATMIATIANLLK
ncbi:MAG: SLBB domain-containing protein [Prevotella sp.]|nr:SLBB domain-containing protein [Prevotella sp.]